MTRKEMELLAEKLPEYTELLKGLADATAILGPELEKLACAVKVVNRAVGAEGDTVVGAEGVEERRPYHGEKLCIDDDSDLDEKLDLDGRMG